MKWITIDTDLHGAIENEDRTPFSFISIGSDKFIVPMRHGYPELRDLALMEEMTNSDVGLILRNKNRYGLIVP